MRSETTLTAVTEIYSDPQQVPWRFNPQTGDYEFLRLTRDKIAEASFLDHRAPGADGSKTYVSFEELKAAASAASKPQTPAYIFHIAFCSSTLISRCLDAPGKALALKEPLSLVSIAHAKGFGNMAGGATYPELFRLTNDLLARPHEGTERAVIKPSNGANDLLADVLALEPNAKVLLLFTNIRRFLLSIVKRGQVGRFFARALLRHPWGEDQRISKMSAAQVLQLTDLHAAALAWLFQTDSFAQALSQYPQSRIRALDASGFEKDPRRALGAMDSFFELGLGEEHIETVMSGPLLTQDAKTTDQAFDAGERAEDEKRLEVMYGDDFDNTIAWAEQQPFHGSKALRTTLFQE